MLRILILITYFIFSTTSFCQQKLDVQYEARYELNFKEHKNQKPEYLKNTFILLMNNRESFFKNMSVYVKDSLVKSGKIRETGDIQKDYPVFGKYVPNFPYTIYKKENQVTFANSIPFSGEFRYNETVNFEWKITKETKTINGVLCTKATTKKWGRNWIAYYSPKHLLPFGPYKFSGLPGLIFEVSDETKDYTFTLYRYKKRQSVSFQLFNYPKAKTISKANYNKIRLQAEIHPNFLDGESDPKTRKEMTKYAEQQAKSYNPIELTD